VLKVTSRRRFFFGLIAVGIADSLFLKTMCPNEALLAVLAAGPLLDSTTIQILHTFEGLLK